MCYYLCTHGHYMKAHVMSWGPKNHYLSLVVNETDTHVFSQCSTDRQGKYFFLKSCLFSKQGVSCNPNIT